MRARETRHIYTFSPAARGSEERRTAARGLALVYHSRVTLMCNSCKVARIYFHGNVFFKWHCRRCPSWPPIIVSAGQFAPGTASFSPIEETARPLNFQFTLWYYLSPVFFVIEFCFLIWKGTFQFDSMHQYGFKLSKGRKLNKASGWRPGAGARVLPMMAYKVRLCPKGVSFSGFRHMKG